ncbi:MAG: cupin domain-containing protein [Balneolaceae bacterium]|nr:MAG: cupin domain-containing protein [Balneolaceae bacterium]
MISRKEELISKLSMQPHPEGGFYAETYRSEGAHQGESEQFPNARNFKTGIYYLLGSGDTSHFHRIKSDEMWHHYEGSSITIHMIHQDGLYRAVYLGKNFDSQQLPQLVVPANTWFGVTVDDENSYALCGCTVSPGFDFRDFEMAGRYQMLQAFPEHEAIIKKLTKPVL